MNNLELFSELSDKIELGELDSRLSAIRKLVDTRIELVREKVKATDFTVGDKVVINERCGTKYLRGETAIVTAIRRTKLTILLDNPKGRFARKTSAGETYSADVIVPIEIVDKQ